jgi:hypothetical protein
LPLDYHTLETVDGATPTNRTDRLIVGFLPAVANAAGSAGATVTVPISGLSLPAVYAVHATPASAVIASVPANSKTVSGFNLVLTPLSSSATVPASSTDIVIFA